MVGKQHIMIVYLLYLVSNVLGEIVEHELAVTTLMQVRFTIFWLFVCVRKVQCSCFEQPGREIKRFLKKELAKC